MGAAGACKAVRAALTAWYHQGHLILRYLTYPATQRLSRLRDRLTAKRSYGRVKRAYDRADRAVDLDKENANQLRCEAHTSVSDFLGLWDGAYCGKPMGAPASHVPLSSHEPFRKFSTIETQSGKRNYTLTV